MVEIKKKDTFLSWSMLIQVSEGQDPLGLNLRVSARLSSQLLYCITSITPRARYYSFLPWCVADFIEREKGKTGVKSLRDAIISRESMFALGCIAWHDGNSCDDGRLVGSDTLSPLYEMIRNKRINKEEIKYVEQPAFDAYNASIAGLEIYKLESDQEMGQGEEKIQLSFDNIELSELGTKVAESYRESIRKLPVIQNLLTWRTFQIKDISEWGKCGGLCELREGSPPDQKILIDLFFNKVNLKSISHEFRRHTLALLLKAADKMSIEKIALDEDSFNDAVYFNTLRKPSGMIKKILWPSSLEDIATRWRMFQFHFYLSFALESILVTVVNKALSCGIEGFALDELVKELGSRSIVRSVDQILQIGFDKSFLEMTPQEIIACSRIDIKNADRAGSMKLDNEIGIKHVFSERNLYNLIDENALYYTPEGIILSLILLTVVTLRYIKWENTAYGNWLLRAVDDPYKDITVPIILRELRGNVLDFWNTPWRVLAPMLINRFVIRQHVILALDKSWDGSRAFFHADQDIIRQRKPRYEKPTCHNTRFMSAVLILKDLNLLRSDSANEDILKVTSEGKAILENEFSQ